jgi:hypothetical protein
MVPRSSDQSDQGEGASQLIALRKVAGRGYEVTGFLSAEDGAVVEQAVSKLRALESQPEGTDPMVILSRWWLDHAPAAQDRPTTDHSEARAADPSGLAGADAVASIVLPTIKRCCEVNPAQSPTLLSITSIDSTEATVRQQADNCAQPGCSAVPRWCDFHSAVDRLGHTLLTAA